MKTKLILLLCTACALSACSKKPGEEISSNGIRSFNPQLELPAGFGETLKAEKAVSARTIAVVPTLGAWKKRDGKRIDHLRVNEGGYVTVYFGYFPERDGNVREIPADEDIIAKVVFDDNNPMTGTWVIDRREEASEAP